MDPFFEDLERRRIENKAKEVNKIVKNLKKQIGDRPHGSATVHSTRMESEVVDQVRAKVGTVSVRETRIPGTFVDVLEYRVDW